MELDTLIEERRSIRKFLPKEVEQEKIERILNSARLCQSAKNRQPWKFMVLQGEQKDGVADIMLQLFEEDHPELPKYFTSSKNSARIIKEVPTIILVFREYDDPWLTGDLLSIGAAIEHMALQTVQQGLGFLWIRDVTYSAPTIAKYTGYGDLQLICALAVGYPNEAPHARPRKSLEEIMLTPKI